ncbi:MAG TPA: flagellar motor protein MotB [Pirellulaceae bacterium]|nr:flagellar motor protein MotB [Pirellulaceae bacterium]HMO91528.1 flagellar motor protein MotB [Pirellulaceae bacterium]HMP68225.1 flagellar motor protein MotB [Pirellulaceae bacterium]
MAKKIIFPPQKDDIPPWFMTYSDVITLLMTFFILLLTFSTMEPEKFDRVQTSVSSATSATGIHGVELQGQPKETWVSRVRPPSSRIALRGAEMPPITKSPPKEAFSKGMEALKPDEKRHNEVMTHFFDVRFNRVFASNGEITAQGKILLSMLAAQLRDLPFQVAFQFSNQDDTPKISAVMMHLINQERTRPGSIGMSLIKDASLDRDSFRIVIKHHLVNQP